MKDSKACKISSCIRELRHEILGYILLVIATYLTIVSASSVGIAAMFIIGFGLCCYRCCLNMMCGTKHIKNNRKSDT